MQYGIVPALRDTVFVLLYGLPAWRPALWMVFAKQRLKLKNGREAIFEQREG
jgi:hypothetical protein